MRAVRVAMIKAMPKKWAVRRNWNVLESLIGESADKKPDVIVTPECYLDGYVTPAKDWTRTKFARIAQTEDKSAYLQHAARIARRLRSYFVFGCTERVEKKFYNAAFVFDRKGKLRGKYYKTHLQDHDKRFAPGMDLPVFEADFGTFGVLICADRRWPESARTLRLKGADILFMPTYGMHHHDNEWWMRTRSYENGMFVCFTHPNVVFITNPRGQTVAKLESNVDDVLVHDVDLDEVDVKSHLLDRRPDLYGVIAEKNT